MSRRRGNKGRRRSARRPGRVFLELDGGAADGLTLKVPGFTADQYWRVRELAAAGDIGHPLIVRFVQAVGESVGHDVAAGPAPWTELDTVKFLRWLDMVPAGEWTGLDDVEAALLAGGAS